MNPVTTPAKPDMRITNIALDFDQLPTFIRVVMTTDVAVRIRTSVDTAGAAWAGDLRWVELPAGVAAKVCKHFGTLPDPDEVTAVITDCLAGALFNRFFRDGVNDYLAMRGER